MTRLQAYPVGFRQWCGQPSTGERRSEVQLTVTNRDISRLLAIADPARHHEPDPLFPPSVLHDLAELVPCDDLHYQCHDPYRELALGFRTEDELLYVPDDTDQLVDAFWANYWIWPCSLPERTGNHNTVEANAYVATTHPIHGYREFNRMAGRRHEAAISLPADGQISRRILLFRSDGSPFSERELLLLTLIRPHLAELVRARPPAPITPKLTARQQQTLRLAGAGLTNRQIARRLTIAEGTVRKHLENAYATLNVTNRTAAVAAITDK
jgi:DNA-binding CsgD family transcriptional regulator